MDDLGCAVNHVRACFLKKCQSVVCKLYALTSCIMTNRWRGVTTVIGPKITDYQFNNIEPQAEETEIRSRGEYSLIWAIRGRAAGQGMFFWPRCPKQGIQFDLLLS